MAFVKGKTPPTVANPVTPPTPVPAAPVAAPAESTGAKRGPSKGGKSFKWTNEQRQILVSTMLAGTRSTQGLYAALSAHPSFADVVAAGLLTPEKIRLQRLQLEVKLAEKGVKMPELEGGTRGSGIDVDGLAALINAAGATG